MSISSLLGEFECKVDDKCRIILPNALKKQISPEAQDRFAILRGFDGCLLMFPFDCWLGFKKRFEGLEYFSGDDRNLLRVLRSGGADVQLDSQNRILLPKRLLDEINIRRDVILLALDDRIEIWDRDTYMNKISVRPPNLEQLAEDYLAKKNRKEGGHGVS